MRKQSTIIIEHLPSLRTSDLKNWDTISNLCVPGKDNCLTRYQLTYELTRETLILGYYVNGGHREQFIDLCFEPSNLGTGEVWYFICPQTEKKCRKLVLWNGKFIHQSNIQNLYYKQQTESITERVSFKWIRKQRKYLELVKKQEQKYYKPMYGGYDTRLAVRATQALHRYAIAISNENEVWAWFRQKPDHQD